jgi:short-subunit dehydrogenase
MTRSSGFVGSSISPTPPALETTSNRSMSLNVWEDKMTGKSKGKTALITGASSGIGKGFAASFAADGYDLVLAARGVAKMEALGAELTRRHSVKVQVIGVDLETPSGAKALFDDVKARGLTIDALVNNAGYGSFGEFKDADLGAQLKMMHLNMDSLVSLTRLFLPDLIARKGGILNVASTAAFQPGPLMAVYYATKSFVLFFSEAVAEELARDGVTVTTLCPGPTQSGFQEKAAAGDSGLFKGRRLPTSEAVAQYGFDSFQRGKRVVIPGLVNWLMAESVRFTPRRVMTAMVMYISRRV